MIESALFLSVGGGMLARQIKHAVYGPPGCPATTSIMPLAQPAALRIPVSPETCAAWAAGALMAQALVLLACRIAAHIRGGTILRVRTIGASRVELSSTWRGGGRGKHYHHHGSPRSAADVALKALLRRPDVGAVVVVVNV